LIGKAVAVSITGLSLTGCYGSYGLFNKMHKFNGSVGDKWIASVVNFISWVIPVYPICLLADFLILNTIEFWTGSNPLAMNSDVYQETDENGTTLVAVKNTDGTLSVSIEDISGNTANFTLEREGNEVRVLDAEGAVVAFHTVRQ
jgi:hypothetical protein